jgi:hypothetical protein
VVRLVCHLAARIVTAWTSIKSFLARRPVRRRAPDLAEVRRLCVELLADIPGVNRDGLVFRLEQMRRVDDMPHLRGALFDVVSHFHGESIARDRITVLDIGLMKVRPQAIGVCSRSRGQDRRTFR